MSNETNNTTIEKLEEKLYSVKAYALSLEREIAELREKYGIPEDVRDIPDILPSDCYEIIGEYNGNKKRKTYLVSMYDDLGIYERAFNDLHQERAEGITHHLAFANKKYAEMFKNRMRIIADMLHFKYLYDRDYDPNWATYDNYTEFKYIVVYHKDRETFTTYGIKIEDYFTVYFSTQAIAQKCADWLNYKYNRGEVKSWVL